MKLEPLEETFKTDETPTDEVSLETPTDEVSLLRNEVAELRAMVEKIPGVLTAKHEAARLNRINNFGASSYKTAAQLVTALRLFVSGNERMDALQALGMQTTAKLFTKASDEDRAFLEMHLPFAWRDEMALYLVPDSKVPKNTWVSMTSRRDAWSRPAEVVSTEVGKALLDAGLEVKVNGEDLIYYPTGFTTGGSVRFTAKALKALLKHDVKFKQAYDDKKITFDDASEDENRIVFADRVRTFQTHAPYKMTMADAVKEVLS